ncbi:MAG: ribosome assembly RNA-binding protein YhbY [Proteobacteria bacterium]|nr:ribosome assembly RNA-binding protein YhbY [Pseudomonadota bacterium]
MGLNGCFSSDCTADSPPRPYNTAVNSLTQTAPPTPLSERQRKFLRGLAHPLEPVVWIGNPGLTDSVVAETERALRDHELIKVKVRASDRATREAALQALVERTASSLVHRIGHVAVLYRPHKDKPGIVIPAA